MAAVRSLRLPDSALRAPRLCQALAVIEEMMLEKRIEGIRAELVDEDGVEVFTFHDGSISATLGSKSGAVIAPILDYEITGKDSLIIKGLFPIILDRIVFSENEIRACRNGENVVYKTSIKKMAKQKCRLP